MNVFEKQLHVRKEHRLEHLLGQNPTYRDYSCKICHPIPPSTTLSTPFVNFWQWISTYCYAFDYSSYTITSFNVYIQLFKEEIPASNLISQQLTDITYKLLLSVQYSQAHPEDHITHYLINLTVQTHYFDNPVTEERFLAVQNTAAELFPLTTDPPESFTQPNPESDSSFSSFDSNFLENRHIPLLSKDHIAMEPDAIK